MTQLPVTEYYCRSCGWTEPVFREGDPAVCPYCDGEYMPESVFLYGGDQYKPRSRERDRPVCGSTDTDTGRTCQNRVDEEGLSCWRHNGGDS